MKQSKFLTWLSNGDARTKEFYKKVVGVLLVCIALFSVVIVSYSAKCYLKNLPLNLGFIHINDQPIVIRNTVHDIIHDTVIVVK